MDGRSGLKRRDKALLGIVQRINTHNFDITIFYTWFCNNMVIIHSH